VVISMTDSFYIKPEATTKKFNLLGQPEMTVKFDIFLSHSSVDKPWVIKLKDDLLRYGVSVWLDEDEIRPGDLFVDALESALVNCRTVALIVSPEAICSGWVKDEYSRALSLANAKRTNLRLIPVLLQEAELPGFLQNRKWVDFQDEADYARSVWKLVWGINGEKPAQLLNLSAPSFDVSGPPPAPLEEPQPKYRVRIYLQGDLNSVSPDQRSAAKAKFAEMMEIPAEAIALYNVYEGSVVFDLGVPPRAVQRLRSLLRDNSAQLRRLRVKKVILELESGLVEEWIFSERKFSLKKDWHKMEPIAPPWRSMHKAKKKAMTLMELGADQYRPTILLSCSHKNETEKEQLLTYLHSLVRTKSIDIWSDDRVKADSNWREEFTRAINQADAAILLITSDFLATEFISDENVLTLLKRRKEKGLYVLPVIARQCAWDRVLWLREMEVKPKDGKPVWRRDGQPDETLNAIVKAIIKEIHNIFKAKSINFPYAPTEKSLSNADVVKPTSQELRPTEKSLSKTVGAKPTGQKVIPLPFRLPIIDEIAAGSPTLISDENIVEFIEVYEKQDGELVSQIEGQSLDIALLGTGRLNFSEEYEHFVVQVSGDSMDRADILPGDYVILRRSRVVEGLMPSSGDIVAAVFRDEDDKATLKRYLKESDWVVFKPESSSIVHQPISLPLQAFADDNPQVEVVGIAIAVLKPQPPASASEEPQG